MDRYRDVYFEPGSTLEPFRLPESVALNDNPAQRHGRTVSQPSTC
jgi:hypothetical protein